MKLASEQLRIPLSRIAAIVGLFVICSTNSYWDTTNELISSVYFCLGVILVAVASLGRMWCSVYIAGYKNNELVTCGPYSLCRNPLYLFSMVGVVGVGFSTETLVLPLCGLLLFAIYYPFVIKSEERRLESRFGVAFKEYKRKVPSFLPRLSSFEEPAQYTVNPIIYRRHMVSALWFVWLVGILEVIEGLKEAGVLGHLWTLY